MAVLRGEDKIGNPREVRHKVTPPSLPPRGKLLSHERNFRAAYKGIPTQPDTVKASAGRRRGSSSRCGGTTPHHRPYFAPVYGLLGNLIRTRDLHHPMPRRGISRSNFFHTPVGKNNSSSIRRLVLPARSRERTGRFRVISVGTL